MKKGDIIRRKTTDEMFTGSYYYVIQSGIKYVYALKSNNANDNQYVLIKRDFYKVKTAKIRVTNKVYHNIECLENNADKTIEHILSKRWEEAVDTNPHVICIVNNVGQNPMYFIYRKGEKVLRRNVKYTSTGVLNTHTYIIKITLGYRIF